jgi:serine/threonine protein kinase
MQQQIKKIDGYIIYIDKLLGRGSFASVYVGKQESTTDLVAVKILSKDSSKSLLIKFKRISI